MFATVPVDLGILLIVLVVVVSMAIWAGPVGQVIQRYRLNARLDTQAVVLTGLLVAAVAGMLLLALRVVLSLQ